MICAWGSALAACSLLATAPAAAQGTRELGAHVLVTGSDPAFAGGGLYGAVRPSPRTRAALGLTLGGAGDDLAGRGELLAHFLLSPAAERGVGVYLGGGIAYLAAEDPEGYVVLVAGVEGRPGGSSGWALEAGLGGGARLALGYRWRWFAR